MDYLLEEELDKQNSINLCPCGSGLEFMECCEPYISILDIKLTQRKSETVLIDWFNIYSIPIINI